MNYNIHGNIGILQQIKDTVDSSNIAKKYGYRFSNFSELTSFFNEDSSLEHRRIRNVVTKQLEQEIEKLIDEIELLQVEIARNSSKIKQSRGVDFFKGISLLTGLYYDIQLNRLNSQLNKKHHTLLKMRNSFDITIQVESERRLKEFIEDKDIFMNSIKPLKAGAEGELAVLNNLRNLPSTYHIINDFSIDLSRTIFDSKTNSYISSVQIDHIVIGQNGIFCIETKNWSKNSSDYYNPIDQNYRHALILHILSSNILNERISVKNIVATNASLQVSSVDPYARILNYAEITGYILHYKNPNTQLSGDEIHLLVDNLLHIKEERFAYI